MTPNRVTQLCLTLGDDPDSVQAVSDGQVQRIRLTEAIALYCTDSPSAVLRALAEAATELADEKDAKAIVALNTPHMPRVPASLHPVGPDYGTGRAS